jgi:hypothetical protein
MVEVGLGVLVSERVLRDLLSGRGRVGGTGKVATVAILAGCGDDEEWEGLNGCEAIACEVFEGFEAGATGDEWERGG